MTELLGWLVAAVLLLVAAWQAVDLREAHWRRLRQQIAVEEAQAWAEEYQRESAALANECERLRDQLASLQELHVLRTRQALAANYRIIASNVEWKRRLPGS